MIDQYDKTEWVKFLADFSRRNRLRRARLEYFDHQQAVEESQETQLERIAVDLIGEKAPLVIITRLDYSTMEPEIIVNTIPHVQRVGSQLDIDNSESGLEVEGKDRVLTILRMESLVDGAS